MRLWTVSTAILLCGACASGVTFGPGFDDPEADEVTDIDRVCEGSCTPGPRRVPGPPGDDTPAGEGLWIARSRAEGKGEILTLSRPRPDRAPEGAPAAVGGPTGGSDQGPARLASAGPSVLGGGDAPPGATVPNAGSGSGSDAFPGHVVPPPDTSGSSGDTGSGGSGSGSGSSGSGSSGSSGSGSSGSGSGSGSPKPGDFRTQTQGGWSGPAAGDNPGAYRDAHFASAFAAGLTVGCAQGHELHLTSAAAVAAFLPQGGAPGVLDQDYVDPQATAAGVLAGQVVTLALSVGFDAADPDFGASDTLLGELVLTETACAGMTVAAVLELGNDVLGGCSTALPPAATNACVDAVNQAFTDGKRTSKALRLP